MKAYLIVSLLLLIVCSRCSSVKPLNDCELLHKAIQSDEFIKFGQLCIGKKDADTLYNGTEYFNACPAIVLNCGKSISLVNAQFTIDVNSEGKKIKFDGTFIYEFVKTSKGYKLAFFNNISNSRLVLMYNNRYALVESNVGAF
jgi:hypothetical protein